MVNQIRIAILLALVGLVSQWSHLLAQPKINGPEVYGARPGKDFIYTIPVQVRGPFRISAQGLPKGVRLNAKTAVMTGNVKQTGKYAMELTVKATDGIAKKQFTLVVGDRLALTPPMGWSSWYSYGRHVTQEQIERTAAILKEKGLQQYGWNLIEIDDPWARQPPREDTVWQSLKSRKQPIYTYYEGPDNLPERQGSVRDEQGNLVPNRFFPDLKGLIGQLHADGFKVGIYSSPGPITCAGASGSYGYEYRDAAYWAALGFDYLKYDWCSYGAYAQDDSPEEYKKPYRLMSDALRKQKRDIIYALCQYGMNEVWSWGDEVGGQLWRTGQDIRDNWKSVYSAMKNLADKAGFVKPGNWNDPDILQIGTIGGNDGDGEKRKNGLTEEEQRTHFSMWCMLSAPLLIGANLEELDDFTRSLLTNEEVIALDQDALGRAATLEKTLSNGLEVWRKPLADGSEALAVLNPSDQTCTLILNEVVNEPDKEIKDLWKRETVSLQMKKELPAHAVWLLHVK